MVWKYGFFVTGARRVRYTHPLVDEILQRFTGEPYSCGAMDVMGRRHCNALRRIEISHDRAYVGRCKHDVRFCSRVKVQKS